MPILWGSSSFKGNLDPDPTEGVVKGERGQRDMRKQLPLFIIILVVLAAYAIFLARGALHRGNLALFIIMIFIAVILWNRSQKRS